MVICNMERLQKYMAHCGLASRRECEEIIRQGRVTVNGEVVSELGSKINPFTDEICVDGKVLDKVDRPLYILLNKPSGYLSTARDERGRPTVLDLVEAPGRLYPVGRLDMDTKGLIILTNDGSFANMLMHPRYHVPKTYHALVEGLPDGKKLKQFSQGLYLKDGLTAPCRVWIVEQQIKDSILSITLYEGKKRQIKRMCRKIGHPVKELKRVAIGSINDNMLPEGKYRPLTSDEIMSLREEAKDEDGIVHE